MFQATDKWDFYCVESLNDCTFPDTVIYWLTAISRNQQMEEK